MAGEYWAVNQILAKQLHTTDEDILRYTMNLMDKLEQVRGLQKHTLCVKYLTKGSCRQRRNMRTKMPLRTISPDKHMSSSLPRIPLIARNGW